VSAAEIAELCTNYRVTAMKQQTCSTIFFHAVGMEEYGGAGVGR